MFVSYKEKLRDPRWQRKKNEVLNRDNYQCFDCKSTTKNLQVHHLDYIQGIDPWEYPMDMLRTLCEKCHEKEKGRIDMERHLATTLMHKGFLMSDLLAFSCKLETDTQFCETLLKVLRDFQER